MIFDPVTLAELLGLGVISGFLAGLLGIGGGMLMVPALTALLSHRGVNADMAVKVAIATSMATILFTSLANVRAHHQRGAVRWDIVAAMAPGVMIGGLAAGAGMFALVKGAWLALLYAVFISIAATQMLMNRERQSRAALQRALPGRAGLLGMGAGLGLLSGLVGAGGAFISVPFMTWCNVAIHCAVATSAALSLPVALASTVGYLISGLGVTPALPGTFGYLYLPALVVMACASMAMAPLGARAAHKLNVAQLRRLFSALLFGLALYMTSKSLTPLFGG